MENLDLNAKKVELLSDEELKEVTGGKISSEAVIKTVKRICVSKYSKESCLRTETVHG